MLYAYNGEPDPAYPYFDNPNTVWSRPKQIERHSTSFLFTKYIDLIIHKDIRRIDFFGLGDQILPVCQEIYHLLTMPFAP